VVCPFWRRAFVPLCGALCQMAFERQHYMVTVTGAWAPIFHDRSVELWAQGGSAVSFQCFRVCVCVPVCIWHRFGVPPGWFVRLVLLSEGVDSHMPA
jgi:hypothetical protein